MPTLQSLFNIDTLSMIMMALIVVVGCIVGSFSTRYLKGDKQYQAFFILLCTLIIVLLVLVCTNHLAIFWAAWTLSNALLARLMLHKSDWQASRGSYHLALRTFSVGSIVLAAVCTLLYRATDSLDIQQILNSSLGSQHTLILAGLICVAMTQSAAWPFHHWLISSLNSPTPVSALMHAGLVNAGGFLLARFSPLFFEHQTALLIIFSVGVLNSILGTLWKLIQSDVKRQLACSTMSQMGFMMMQCGLGLFPAAVAHLTWHGLFKAQRFLGSASAAQEASLDEHTPPSLHEFVLALFSGCVAAVLFGLLSGNSLFANDTTCLLTCIAWIAGAQVALVFIQRHLYSGLIISMGVNALLGCLYGFSVHLFHNLFIPMHFSHPQPLHWVYWSGLICLLVAWLTMLFGGKFFCSVNIPIWRQKLYVRLLNASQPHPSTVTTHRNHYNV